MTKTKYTRRDFLKNLSIVAYGVSSGISLLNCSKENPTSKIINGLEYKIENGVISSLTKINNNIKLGLMSDLHAHKYNSQYFANQLNKEGVDAFLLTGDLSHSFGDKEGIKNDYNEIISVVEPIADTGKLVMAIPGNHEQKITYDRAMTALSRDYPNVVDMKKTPVADLNGLTIAAMGGNDNPNFNIPQGYLLRKEDFDNLEKLAKQFQKNKPLLIATHIPQSYQTKNGLDVISSGRNVGSGYLAGIRKAVNSKFGVSGHIHEAKRIINSKEQLIKPGDFSDNLDFNPGAVYDYSGGLRPSAGIMEFSENKARAYNLER